MAFRGLNGNELSNNQAWWKGPEFLCSPGPKSEWPYANDFSVSEEACTELVRDAPVVSQTFAVQTTPYKLLENIDCQHFSSLYKLLKTTVYMIHFVKRLMKNRSSSNSLLMC